MIYRSNYVQENCDDMVIYANLGDRIIGERIVATYQNFQPKNGYRATNDGSDRDEMTLIKSVCCTIEKPIQKV